MSKEIAHSRVASSPTGISAFCPVAHSTAKCNKLIPGVEENLAWGSVSENLSGARIELILDRLDFDVG